MSVSIYDIVRIAKGIFKRVGKKQALFLCTERVITVGAYLLCPFAKYENGRRLGCESCTIAFTDVTEKNEYIKRFCCTYEYEKCSHAQRLLEKYRS